MDAPYPLELCSAWSEFLFQDQLREPGLDIYEDIFRHPLLFPLQRAMECRAMHARARAARPQVVCEIGSDKGGSFYHWIKGHPDVRKAIACDERGVPWNNHFQSAFPAVAILAIPEGSQQSSSVEMAKKFLGEDRIDCLFLDGAKHGTERDFKLWVPLCRPGGMVFIHDVTDDIHPRRFFESIKGLHTERIYDASEVHALERLRLEAPAYAGWLAIWRGTSCGVGVVTLDEK
jgi:predicted O-methyltransferase YrrM